jgi:hypothetical protein
MSQLSAIRTLCIGIPIVANDVEKPCGSFMLDARTMQTMPDITKHKEMYIWNTVLDIIRPYSMQTRVIGRSRKDRSHR